MTITTIIQENPRVSIVIIGLLITLLSTLVTKWVTNQERMKELKDKQKENQKLMKEHKGNATKMMEIQKEMMGHSMEMMKQSFKPMIFTLIPIIIIFGAIRNVYATTELVKSWIWYYIVSAMIGSIIFRKILKVY